MSFAELFASCPAWAIFILTLLLVVASVEAGFWTATKRQRRAGPEHEQEAPVGAMVGATLGLLAFLLAITFGMAADAFHARREALLHEANAIRTAYLRADLVGEPERAATRQVLREYVDSRLEWAGVAKFHAPSKAEELLDRL